MQIKTASKIKKHPSVRWMIKSIRSRLRHHDNQRRFIFTVTSGRSGTNYLAWVLSCFKGIDSRHEPSPKFMTVMPGARWNEETAKSFLCSYKLPAIATQCCAPVYAETSHLFCKGFLEAWLKIDAIPVPDIIILDRDIRSIALSLWQLNDIPGRTKTGQTFTIHPSEDTCFTRLTKNPEKLTDYQLCYWYCLEIEERKKIYAKRIEELNGRVFRTSIDELNSIRGINRLRKNLNLSYFSPEGAVRWILYRTRKNEKKSRKRFAIIDPNTLDELENEVKAVTTSVYSEGD